MLAVQKKLEKSSVEKLLDIIKKAKDHEENSTTKDGIHACDRQGRTVLHIAAAGQSWEVFQLLVDSGANKEARDIQGRTVFHHAAIKENNDLLDMLMCNDTLKDLNVRDRHGWSPLHWASRSQTGDTRTIELLLKGKNVIVERSQPSVHGWTPENIAIFHNASAISSFLQKPAKNTAEGLEAEDLVKTERQQGQKRWKVGQRHRWCECDGCGQQVSLCFHLFGPIKILTVCHAAPLWNSMELSRL
ncbi:ankyrin [Cadophora sp. DSE1049]|nr:ankyrin [Cadophora sp. DSE1049]